MNEVWTDEHRAKNEPIGRVLYDVDDDLFTVKTGPNTWVAYHAQGHLYKLNNYDMDDDRGDQIVGEIEMKK